MGQPRENHHCPRAHYRVTAFRTGTQALWLPACIQTFADGEVERRPNKHGTDPAWTRPSLSYASGWVKSHAPQCQTLRSSPDLICSSLGALLAKHPVHTGQIWIQIPAQPLPKNQGVSEVVHLQNGANGVSPKVDWDDGLRKSRQGSACRLRHVQAQRQGVWFFFPPILTVCLLATSYQPTSTPNLQPAC